MFMILRMLLLIFCACLIGVQQARAVCSISVPPQPRYVGNTTSDNKCTDNDIQSAINAAACPGTRIYITGERNYTGQHLVISGQSLSLIGSAAACGVENANGGGSAVPTAPLRTLTGSSTLGASVISIIGNSTVTLQYLDITGGNLNGSGKGGGIFFYGSGALTLDTTTVDSNQADSGGGINMNSPSSSALTLTLLKNSLVTNNVATTSGGGILLEGNSQLIAISDQTLIGSNQALGGYGGGIHIIGPARADIGSAGHDSAGVVSNNSAVYGGGIAARATQSNAQNAVVQLFTSNAEHPVDVQNNHASALGGAIYLLPFEDSTGSSSDAVFCAYNFRIDNNTAADGAAIYSDDASASGQSDHGSSTYMNLPAPNPPLCGAATPATFGAVVCAADAPCNALTANRAEQMDTTPTSGATIFVRAGLFNGERISLQHNQGGELIRAAGNASAYPVAALSSCLVSSNSFTGDLILAEYAVVELQNCTIAGNIFFSFGPVFPHYLIYLDANSHLVMNDSIVYETNLLTLDQPGNVNDPMHIVVKNVLSNDITTLPSSPSIIVGDPLFTDTRNVNYRLKAFVQNGHVTHSPAIDFSATAISNLTDLEGKPFDQDVPTVPNNFGPHDLGAYEMRPIPGRIFADGFGDAISIVY
ncbi:hypothetical protein ELE36_14390 [Pseudolysobacter antarcticus]|uniref:CSLREA domain-containing protein n=1 Tax=Pseudolysobacter antarcticus TaxID=2511995 RepID=A0A411HM30_9GAMM|nr:hypothetical protein [Pseudolysobacter antarcticus]QBB71450.1 hypothetical protein ELE36_14390 [Pseudolysobacter antarcticus]